MVSKQKKTEESNMKSSCKSGKVRKKTTIHKTTLPSSPQDDSPIRAIVCLNKINDMKRFEETEDCFILGFDPYDPVVLSKLSLDKNDPAYAHHDDAVDLSVIAEKGQVACRDYPHSRHVCLKFPFKTTPHESYCEMVMGLVVMSCYCYVCDSAAPCKYWTLAGHCNAENVGYWKDQRSNMKNQTPVAVAPC